MMYKLEDTPPWYLSFLLGFQVSTTKPLKVNSKYLLCLEKLFALVHEQKDFYY